MIGTTIALAGCGGSNSNPNGTGGPGGGPGGVAIPGGALSVNGGSFGFSAANAYMSGPRLADMTAGFNQGQQGGDIQLGSYSSVSGNTITGYTAYGSTITMVATAGNSQSCPWGVGLCAAIPAGVVTLTQQEMMAAGLGNAGSVPSVLGFGFDLQFSGFSITGGYADVCVTRDQAGNCHGIQLQFVPH
jgi:hypothetical protein